MNEIEQLRKEIIKLEFQHKKDIVEWEKRRKREMEESQAVTDQIKRLQARTQAQLDHITKLTGIAFEYFEDIDETFDKVSKAAARKRKS